VTTVDLRPQPTAANAFLPHLGSELSRLTHRRLYRILALLLLAGIVVVSVVAFATSSKNQQIPAGALQSYQQSQREFQRQFPRILAGWHQCMAQSGASLDTCGPKPDLATGGPRLEDFYQNKKYVGSDKLPGVVIAISLAGAVLAFILGASCGGAEWSSRSMALQLLWEPRRGRLFAIKWLALALVMVVTTALMLLVGLAFGAVTVALRGTPDLATGVYPAGFAAELASGAGRGLVLVAVAATFGYAVSMLIRNTGAALGAAFVYFAVFENAVRLVLENHGAEPFMLTTNVAAFLIKDGLDVPRKIVQTTDASGTYTTPLMVHLSHGRSLLTVVAYLLLVTIPALWAFTRRDVA